MTAHRGSVHRTRKSLAMHARDVFHEHLELDPDPLHVTLICGLSGCQFKFRREYAQAHAGQRVGCPYCHHVAELPQPADHEPTPV